MALGGCRDERAANAENFAKALHAYLAERGQLCVGKSEWPIDVSEREAELGTRDAKQLPVLERLGLVSASDAVAKRKSEDEVYEVRVKRYELTPEGRKFYRVRHAKNARGELVTTGDLCAVELSLDQVKHWEVTNGANGQQSASVSYTYGVAPAAWTQDPEVERVFPAVARVIHGAHEDELREGVTLTPAGWVADDLLGQTRAPSPTEARVSTR
jgi:hypothetical protein